MKNDMSEIGRKTEQRPWGMFEQFTHNEPSTVKIITIKAGEELSLQFHEHRAEFWRVLEGTPKVTIGEDTRTAETGDEFFIKTRERHRLSGPGKILEIAFGDFDEEDITRLEDKYGRK